MDLEILAWTAVIIIAIALEAATAQLVSIWFAGGGLAGLIAHFLHAPFWLQVIAAAVATLILLLATRPLVRRFLRGKETRTNADRVVGRTAVVTEPIDNVLAKGRVSVLGSDWTARSLDGGAIPAGAQVRVERIEGVKLIVSPENNT
ncbi:MAG: NfeD family protein [Clostridiales bacterium]|nr:NfeD family protein [Clostridiales bacterium]